MGDPLGRDLRRSAEGSALPHTPNSVGTWSQEYAIATEANSYLRVD